MWRLSGAYDPVTGVKLNARLTATMRRLFADATPDTCPTDPSEKHAHLQALALASLLKTEASGSSDSGDSDNSDSGGSDRGDVRQAAAAHAPPEFIAVIDARTVTADGHATVDWGLPVEVPWAVLVELAGQGEVLPVIVNGGIVLSAPGRLNLGRTTRLANRAQRRVLRALYPTCAMPGCAVRYAHCKVHHVWWWENGGGTDLDNLVPLCSRHHHAVHDLGWALVLAADRTLTITYPDHTTVTATPPRRGPPLAAAPPPQTRTNPPLKEAS